MDKIELIIREGIHNGLPANIIAEQVRELVDAEEQQLLRNILDDMDGVFPEYHYEIVEGRVKS